MSAMYGNGILLSERALDYLWGRMNVTVNNIANVDTPGYKSQYITFEDEMGRRIREAGAKDLSGAAVSDAIKGSRAELQTTWTESSRLDGNNVDMDQEQVEMVRTAFEYQYLINSISNDINRLKSAAKIF